MIAHLSFLFLFLITIFPIIIYSTCPSSKCSTSGPTVCFPFQLLPQQNSSWSSPGFNLTCNSQSLTILTIPNSGDFYVRDIDYYHQQLILSDPENCMANRLMSLNLSNSPFDISYYYRNYTFLSCPTELVKSRFTIIDCFSNSSTSVFSSVSPSLAASISNSCTIVLTVPIPISWPYLYDHTEFTSDLNDDFRLSWNITGCIACERAGGFCGPSNGAVYEPGCYRNCQVGTSNRNLRVFKIVVLCFTIQAVSFTVAIAMYFWFMDQRRRCLHWAQARAAIITARSEVVTANGLDELTIESYAKVVVGESKRIPWPNDISCPICLSEYCHNDTLRCIPDCKHCFHADCIDEWLRSNATCPVCRNSSSHS